MTEEELKDMLKRCEKQFRMPTLFTRFVEPVQRPWVGLTDEEFHDLQIKHTDDPWANFKAIEDKLREKNA